MPLNQNRIKGKIVDLIDSCQEETENANDAKNLFAENLAKAIVEEIKELKITYSTGLTAPNGPVTGTFTATIS